MSIKIAWVKTTVPEDQYMWKCPGCKSVHSIPVKGPKAWGWNGSVESPTFTPSVLSWWVDEKNFKHICHMFVIEGKIQFLTDCTHELAGQTVEMQEIPDRWK